MARKELKISLYGEKMRSKLEQYIYAAIARRVSTSTVSHTNTDGTFSPAEWFAGADMTPPRRQLQTSGAMTWENETLTVVLNYEAKTIQE